MKQTLSILNAVFAVLAFFVSCGGSEGSAEGKVCESCGIYGHVTDYETGEDVAHANVQLRPGGDTTLTGSDGMYEFRGLPSGEYSITVSKSGYSDLIDDYVITVRDRMVRRDVQIVNTKCKDGYFFNGLECVNPCDANPCGSEICEATGAETYNCNCSEGYWDGSKCDEFPPCDTKNITPCRDRDTNYIWSARARQDMDWDSAMAYCDNLSEGGYDDWNLPSIDVLKSLYVDNADNGDNADNADNGDGDHWHWPTSKLGDQGCFWSSTSSKEYQAQSTGFGEATCWYTGYDGSNKSDVYSVRCVIW